MKNAHYLQDLIKTFLDKNHKKELFSEQAILKVWNGEMGDFIVSHTKSLTIKNGVLGVKIVHAALKFELIAQKSNIIRKLNDAVGMEVLKDIIFY
jgi:hypothetical protein